MNRLELRMRYKAETALTSEVVDCFARVGRMGDVILDQYSLDDGFVEKIRVSQQLQIPDSDYVNWLEEKLMETLK
jgi:hypothetical protein